MGRQQWEALAADPTDATTQENFRKLFAMPGVEPGEKEQAETHLRVLTDADTASAEHLEAKVYNYLLNFFELYYAHGDFGYNTRAANAFKVPYETDYDGADTLFHWKHKDSYYIKTGNGFHSVKCDLMDKSIEFRVEAGGDPDAETSEQNNNKGTDIKHYRLDRIEEHDGVWQVIFRLAAASTPKT